MELDQQQQPSTSYGGEQSNGSWKDFFIPSSIRDFTTNITNTANEVREAAASVTRTVCDTTGLVHKWKMALDTMVDLRILHQDYKYFFAMMKYQFLIK